MPKFLILIAYLTTSFLAYSQSNEHDCAITIIEKSKGIPQIFIESQGMLYSLGNRGDSLIENRKLNIVAAIPKGLRVEEFGNFIEQTVTEAGLQAKSVLFLHIIYFDSNSALIRNDASAELDKLVALLQRYPFAQTQIIVRSDSRGSSTYNRKLASRRADSIRKYLTEAQVQHDKIQFNISGEEELEMDCTDNQNCDEMLHQSNRRAEFIFNPVPKS